MKNTQANLVVSELEKMSAIAIVEDERVQSKFIQQYNNVHGNSRGEMMYHKMKFDYLRILQEKPELQKCSKLSIYGVFLDIAVNGLDISQGRKPLVYFIPRSVNIGTKENPNYEKRLYMELSPPGEVFIRINARHIRHADNPVIAYDGDVFKPVNDEKGKRVIYEAAVPRKSNKIIGGFIRITKIDGSIEYSWILSEDIPRLKAYSENANSYYDATLKKRVKGQANRLYTSNDGQIDPGFLEAKITKHAFDNYPKVRTGSFTKLQTQEIEEKPIDYGVDIPPYTDDGEIIDAESEQIDNEETF
jgi:hypothetical protein